MTRAADLHGSLVALAQRVRSATSHISVFPLVAHLERWISPVPIGADEPAERERIHFTHAPDFVHPAGDVSEMLVAEEAGGPGVTLRTTFLGLLGSESPLPDLLSEGVLLGDDEGAQQAFFDVFHHRLLSHFYRLWRRYASALTFEPENESSLSRCLQSFVGIDAFGPPQVNRATSPLFAMGLSDLSRCDPTFLDGAALEAMLARVFPQLMARIIPAEPQAVRADPEDVTRLGKAHSTLGATYAYGDEALDTQGVVRLALGPVRRELYQELLPGGKQHRALHALLQEWLAARARVELEIQLEREEAPAFVLGQDFGGALGRDTRLTDGGGGGVRVRVLLSEGAARPTYHDDP